MTLLRTSASRINGWTLSATSLIALASTARAECQLSFAAAVNYAAGGNSQGVTVCDLNADGNPDFAVANYQGNVFVMLGNGSGTFQGAGSFATDREARVVAVGEFNADGRADLAVATNNGSVSVLLGHGNGTFQSAVTYPVLDYACFVAVSDFNADGRSDLVVTGISYTDADVSILLGNGDGTFQSPVGYPTPDYSPHWQVGLADFNSDGNVDLAVTAEDAHGVFVLLGNGNGTLQPAVLYSAGQEPTSVAVSDFNDDGWSDLAVGYSASVAGNVAILLGNGDGTFQAAVDFPFAAGNGHVRIAVGDLNADGRADLVVMGLYGTVSVLLGNGDGTLQAAVPLSVGLNYPGYVAVADFNADGRVDVAATFVTSNLIGSASVLLNTSVCPCPSDLDDDGAVSLSDLAILLAHFGTSSGATDADGDSDADGDVDIQDLANLLAHFGSTCP